MYKGGVVTSFIWEFKQEKRRTEKSGMFGIRKEREKKNQKRTSRALKGKKRQRGVHLRLSL